MLLTTPLKNQSKLYIGNLPFDLEKADLINLFSKNRTVKSVNIIKNKDSGQAQGFGFIEMMNSEEAVKAIQNINNKEFQGRVLNVSIATHNSESRFL